MSVLAGFLPVQQGVACYAALRKRTDELVAAGDVRTRGQIMADTLVERLTGQVLACTRGNLVREMPDWTVDIVHDGLGPEPHTVRITTPTGHTYQSVASGPGG